MTRQHLGQNFLASASWRERVARLILTSGPPSSGSGNIWIEIGPGHGEMTSHLAQQAGHVIAIELDAKLLPGLRALAERLGNVTIVPGDVLTQDLAKLSGGRRFRVCGNLPYYITSPIVHHLFEYADLLEAAFIVVQLEVAERLAASPGVRDYGYLSTFAQFYSRPEILLRIPPGAFRPPPKVASALVALTPPGARGRLRVVDQHAFLEFLKGCFAQKRKMLRNNLRALPNPLDAEQTAQAMERAGIAPRARAEELTLDEFARLFAAVNAG
jgi:16S rRNA (adenine1518-N6/adenine1519-N6)-dimethyltransferase